MFSKKQENERAQIDSLIGANLCIEGAIHFSGGLRLDGVVKGQLIATENTSATIVISKTGRVEGSIQADHVVVDGEVIGEIRANVAIDLQSNAKIRGDVTYRQIEVHSGASIQGKMILITASTDIQSELDMQSSTTNVTYLESNL